jgi:hypothetical protein
MFYANQLYLIPQLEKYACTEGLYVKSRLEKAVEQGSNGIGMRLVIISW